MKVLGGTALAGAMSGTASATPDPDPFVFRWYKVSSNVYDYFGVVAWVVKKDDDGGVTSTYFTNMGAGGNGRVWLGPDAVAAYAVDSSQRVHPNPWFVYQARGKLLATPSVSQSANSSIVFLNNADRSNVGSLTVTYAAGNYGRNAGCVTLSREDLLGETGRSGVVYQDGNDRTLVNVRKLVGGPAVATHATYMYGACFLLCGRWINDAIEFPVPNDD